MKKKLLTAGMALSFLSPTVSVLAEETPADTYNQAVEAFYGDESIKSGKFDGSLRMTEIEQYEGEEASTIEEVTFILTGVINEESQTAMFIIELASVNQETGEDEVITFEAFIEGGYLYVHNSESDVWEKSDISGILDDYEGSDYEQVDGEWVDIFNGCFEVNTLEDGNTEVRLRDDKSIEDLHQTLFVDHRELMEEVLGIDETALLSLILGEYASYVDADLSIIFGDDTVDFHIGLTITSEDDDPASALGFDIQMTVVYSDEDVEIELPEEAKDAIETPTVYEGIEDSKEQ